MIGPIEKHLLVKPPDTSRRTDVFHPSEIVKSDWCHRASYYAVVEEKAPRPERHNLRTQSIFEEGHFIHGKWQSWLGEMGVLYGKWVCEDCHDSRWMLASETFADDTCGRWDYREVPLRDKDLRISGHADGWVVGLGNDYLIEIKSIGPGTLRFEAPHLLTDNNNDADKAWSAVRNPFRTHFLQGQVYLHLLHLMEAKDLLERPAPNEIVFLYEYKANQDHKEFSVEYSPDYLEGILDNCAAILQMTEAPECNVNSNKGCKKCLAFEESA
jgi:hypothetical protein